MDVTIIIPGEYAELVSEVEDGLAARLSYWDTRYHSVQGALNRWAVVVDKLGRYDGYIEEYFPDLGFRDVLADILEVARWPLAAWLLRVVDELDDQFHVKTTLDRDDLMWGGNVDRPLHWWHRRLPPDHGLRTPYKCWRQKCELTGKLRASPTTSGGLVESIVILFWGVRRSTHWTPRI